MEEMNWAPRGDVVILKAILRPEVANKAIKVVSKDAEYYADDYQYFVYDVGETVNTDLTIGDEIFCNLANLKIIHGVTNRKLKETYFFVIDGIIPLRRRGPINI
jgi:hypothetical protein